MRKILIAYFSLQLHTKKVAEKMHDICRGDMFEIKNEIEYPVDFNFLAMIAQKQLENKTFPKLKDVISREAMQQYDVVLLGFPIWWNDLPRTVCTFLKMYDFSNKVIIPFFTHLGTSYGGQSIQTIQALTNGKVASEFAFAVHDDDVDKIDGVLGDWLKKLSEKY